jgi:hypothetical protein
MRRSLHRSLTGYVTGDHGQCGSAQAEAAGAAASWTDPTAMRLTTKSATRRFIASSLFRRNADGECFSSRDATPSS